MTIAASPSRPDRPLLAIALRLAAMVLVSTMFMLIKYAGQQGVSVPELLFWRQALSVPLIAAWLLARGEIGLLATRRMASHAGRASTGMVSLFCNVLAATILPLSLQTTLGFTTPLFAVLIAALILRDQVGPWRWTAVCVGFAGVLIVASPFGVPIPPLGLFAGLGAGIALAGVSFQIRDLARTEAPITCVFWFAFFGAAMTALLMPIYARPHPGHVWLILAAIGVSGTVGQFLITAALRHGAVATVVVMDYSGLIWATLYGWLVWRELPPHRTWFGAPLIIAAGLIITWREHHLARRIPPTSTLDPEALEEMSEGT